MYKKINIKDLNGKSARGYLLLSDHPNYLVLSIPRKEKFEDTFSILHCKFNPETDEYTQHQSFFINIYSKNQLKYLIKILNFVFKLNKK